ncbi:MAG: UPF0280 family protein [Candidatus Riflebacteria bacterium]|nr:UPF0280 family protein [Candidatus Riflebacteria bacterium]
MSYQERTYREWMKAEGFLAQRVVIGESDLFLLARKDITHETQEILTGLRNDIESYIKMDPEFKTTLVPHVPKTDASEIVAKMCIAARKFNVGPMAAVAGAVAELTGKKLVERFGDLIIENGGDIFVRMGRPVVFTLYAGEESPFSGKINFRTGKPGESFGICTSAGTVGHSLSFGKADAVCIIADNAIDADAAATCFGNQVQCKEDVETVIQNAKEHGGVKGIIVTIGDKIGIWGDLEVV